MSDLKFQVDTRLVALLGENYRSTEKAIKELVDNAWDADADTVRISLPQPTTVYPEIIIEDDGLGMTQEELRREYLFIARNRIQRRGDRTVVKKRRVKGRKGIGKFAGLMTASIMKLETWARGVYCSFTITRDHLRNYQDIEGVPIELAVADCPEEKKGTRITLSGLSQELAFPDPNKFKQLLIHEYGREDDFKVYVNGKEFGIDDIKGSYAIYVHELPVVGRVSLRFTISDQRKLREPGIAIRVAGKIVGSPSFLGLDKSEDFPKKLLNKLYGEIEADGLADHVTADWGALIENSELLRNVEEIFRPVLREEFKKVHGREISLAQARLQKKIDERLALLPEYKRDYADKAIKKILNRFYGEPESKLEPIVNVVLDALESSNYRLVLEQLNEARKSDIALLAEILSDFGIVELAIMAEQANARLRFLDSLEKLCDDQETLEIKLHKVIEHNLWVIGNDYTLFSSNKTLKRQIEDFLQKNYKGIIGSKRPDLLLNENISQQYLIVEFKRPNHPLVYEDYQQATRYRNEFRQYTDKEIRIIVIGGKRGNDLPQKSRREPEVEILIYSELISSARKQLDWMLKELTKRTQ